jgi:hypothetical protein
MAMKQGLLLYEKNIHYKHATMEFSGTNLDIGQIKNKNSESYLTYLFKSPSTLRAMRRRR